MNSDPKQAYLAVTESGFKLAKTLKAQMGGHILGTDKHIDPIDKKFAAFSDMVDYGFKHYEALVFIMALGIVARSTAPHIKDKYHDPAVVVVDDLGLHAISYLSGHMGGANELTLRVAETLGASPVITTATDIHGKGAFELYLRARGLEPEPFRDLSKWANMELAEGRPLWIMDKESSISLPKGFISVDEESLADCPEGGVIYIGDQDTPMLRKMCKAIIPIKTLAIGLGFRRGKTEAQLIKAIRETLAFHGLNFESIQTIATIALKAKEKGLIALSEKHNIPITIIDELNIKSVQHLFETSRFVEAAVGVQNVSDSCAYLASGGNLLHNKKILDGVTVAVGRRV